MVSQIIDRKTVGIPGPAADASPELVAAAQQQATMVAERQMSLEVFERLPVAIEAQFGEALGEAVAEKMAEDPTVRAAIVSGVDAEVEAQNLVAADDPRLPIVSGKPPHSWADSNNRMNFYDDETGKLYGPMGIETPRAGLPTPVGSPYIEGLYDPWTGRWAQNALRADGTFTDEAVHEWLARMPTQLFGSFLDRFGLLGLAVNQTRTAGVPLTLSAGNAAPFQETATNVQLRWPVKLAAPTRRWRLHLRNHNDRASQAYPGALAVTGLFFGKQQVGTDGSLSGTWNGEPQQLHASFSTPANGNEWVSPWFESDEQQIQPYAEHMISIGYTCSAQTNHVGQGGVWRSAVSTDAGVTSPGTPLVKSQLSPLDVWIEVEVAQNVPVVHFGPGDSLLAGTGANLPVRDSLANRWALAHGAIAQIGAHHGSTLSMWSTSPTDWKYQKYAQLSRPDAVVIQAASNDIFNGNTLETVQASFHAVRALVSQLYSPNVYAMTVTPRNGTATDAPREAVRSAYNDWLGTIPSGLIQVWDYAAQVASNANPATLDSRYVDSDFVHLNTAGYARGARSVLAPLTRRS